MSNESKDKIATEERSDKSAERFTQEMFDQLQGAKVTGNISESVDASIKSFESTPVSSQTPVGKTERGDVYVQQNFTVTIDKGEYNAPPTIPPETIELGKTVETPEPVNVQVTIKNHGVIYGFGRYCYKQIDDCWFIHLKSNKPLTDIALKTLRRDMKLLYHGHESIDALDWLGYQRMPIQSTLDSIGEGEHVARNFAQIRLILGVLMIVWLVSLVGYSFDVIGAFQSPITIMVLVDNMQKLAFLMLITYLYYAYAYHSYALSIDRFTLKKDFHKQLKAFDFKAWFPLFKQN